MVAAMESDFPWIHHLHSPEAWIALIVGGAEILVHEPSVGWALILMLVPGIALAAWFRILRTNPERELLTCNSTLHFTHQPHQISFRVAEEDHPQIVVRHFNEQVRLIFETHAVSLHLLVCRMDVRHGKV